MLVNIHAMEYAVNLPMWAVNQTEVRINLQIKQTQQAHRVRSPCLESSLSLQGYIHSQVLVDLFKHLQNTLLSGLASAYGEPELLLSAWKIWSKNYKVITQGHCYKWLIWSFTGCIGDVFKLNKNMFCFMTKSLFCIISTLKKMIVWVVGCIWLANNRTTCTGK